MRVLVGFESSGTVRESFRKRGIDAWSCDILPADDGSQFHLQCDVFDVVDRSWDLGIFHPPCTYLTNSAAWAFGDSPYHQKVKPGTLVGAARREARILALGDIKRLMRIPYATAIENPVGAISSEIRKPDQIIHPWQFGDDASKQTCLWLNGVALLTLDPALFIEPRLVSGKKRWANQTDNGQNRLPPSDDRWKIRSKTYQGIADAMAEQWGNAINAQLAAEVLGAVMEVFP